MYRTPRVVLMTRSSKCETKGNLRAAFPNSLRPVTRSGPVCSLSCTMGNSCTKRWRATRTAFLAARASRCVSLRCSLGCRRAVEERADTVLVGERRQSRRLPRRDPQRAAASNQTEEERLRSLLVHCSLRSLRLALAAPAPLLRDRRREHRQRDARGEATHTLSP
jgi:hypothetical protein